MTRAGMSSALVRGRGRPGSLSIICSRVSVAAELEVLDG